MRQRRLPLWVGGLGMLCLLACTAQAPPRPGAGAPAPGPVDEVPERRANAVAALIESLAEKTTASAARSELAGLGAEATPLLLPYLSDSRMKVRWEVVSLLGAAPDPGALLPLADRVLHDDNPHVRWRSLWALGRFPDPTPAVERFQETLRSDAPTASWNAAVALSVFERDEGLPLLHAAALELDGWYRWEAINALGRVHDEDTPEVLAEVLESPVLRERAEATLVLGKIGGERAFELLLAALDDPAPGVRWRACLGLGRMADPRSLTPLRDLLAEETDPRVLEHGREALERIESALRPGEGERTRTADRASIPGYGEESSHGTSTKE